MSLEWLIHPLLEYILLAIGLILCTLLFITLKQDLLRMRNFNAKQQQLMNNEILKVKQELNAAKQLLGDVKENTVVFPQLPPPKQGLNTNHRGQVLRMHRRGERPEQIAAALSLPQNEVDLLLKVHQAICSI